jgi:glycosyltransferase involved in cell wall biosynthesis
MTSNSSPLRLLVKGWRGISHSYALVNQFQMLHWRRHGLAEINPTDMPFIMAHWANGENSAGFNPEDLELIQASGSVQDADAVYQIYAPLHLEAHATLPTLTFAVTEFGLGNKDVDANKIRQYAAQGGRIHTPSQWSKRRLVANGIPDDIIHVVGHAVDANYFHQLSASQIEENRSNLGFQPEDVVLLNVGTHHWNKGLDVLIKAFARARQTNKHLKLLLKDQRSTYLVNSESYVQQVLSEVGLLDQELISSIRMISGHLTLAQLNALYSVADAYVTPYRAEGFNLPALEAQACGTPVIATQGGATDDFLSHTTTSAISGTLIENSHLKDDLPVNAYIEPSLEQLTQVLQGVQRKAVHAQGGAVQTWAAVCRQLNRVFFQEEKRHAFESTDAEPQLLIFCDGGIGNRINSLVSGLAIARSLKLTYCIHWPINNWCAAPFEAIFENPEPLSTVSISGLKGMLDGAEMLLHDDIASTALGVDFASAYRFASLEEFSAQCTNRGKQIFYYPAVLPSWVPEALVHEELRSLRFSAYISNAVRSFVTEVMRAPYYGIHLRRTDLNVGLSDQEVFTLVRQYPEAQFFVCSDDPAAEALASAHPNVHHRAKQHHVEKSAADRDWLAQKHDDDGRLYYGNIQRNQDAVIEGTIDMLVLAHSQIVGYSGSTFQRMARLIGEVAPMIDLARPAPLPYYNPREIERQIQAKLIGCETVIQAANTVGTAGDTNGAIDILQAAIAHFEGHQLLDVLHTLGVVYLNQSKYRLGCIYLERVVQKDGSRFSSWLHLAFAEWAIGNHDAAKVYLTHALQVTPVAVSDAENALIKNLRGQLFV